MADFEITQLIRLLRLISVNGGYGKWSLNTTCSVKCGEGFEIWIRECNKPEPKYGGRNCSFLGESIKYRRCSRKPYIGKYIPWFSFG